MSASQNEFVNLYFREGSSDKVYQASLEDDGTGNFVVKFAFGRRGTYLNEGTKTSFPVPYAKAKKIYDALVSSKTQKGYTNGPPYSNGLKPPSGATQTTAITPTPVPSLQVNPGFVAAVKKTSVNDRSNFSGLLPQLLNSIEEDEALELLDDDVHILQEKKDGKRLMVEVADRKAKGINRKGSNIGISDEISNEASKCPEDIILDGEDVNCKHWVFDIMKRGDDDLRKLPYLTRLANLQEIVLFYFDGDSIEIVRTAQTPADKHKLFETLKAEGAEGVVFKDKNAKYTTGRPASGGDQLKYKFYETASVLVSAQNAQRSVAMQLFDGSNWVDVGNVTIPPNKNIPPVGAVIEVRYLYAFQGGAIYQPTYLGVRDDIDKDECTTEQLKYKAQMI
jgi:bifunctional non-homologous end joining protein LigD